MDETDKETNINILFEMALAKLVFMPFGYLVDKYRWDLFSGWADETDMNCHWVKLRMDIQGTTNEYCTIRNTAGYLFQMTWIRTKEIIAKV